MAKELSEDTVVNVSIKTLGGIVFAIATIVGMWFALQADIQEAKVLPVNEWNDEWLEKLPPPSISRMEFDMKDQLVRQTIMTTQEDVKEIKIALEKLNDKIDGLR